MLVKVTKSIFCEINDSSISYSHSCCTSCNIVFKRTQVTARPTAPAYNYVIRISVICGAMRKPKYIGVSWDLFLYVPSQTHDCGRLWIKTHISPIVAHSVKLSQTITHKTHSATKLAKILFVLLLKSASFPSVWNALIYLKQLITLQFSAS